LDKQEIYERVKAEERKFTKDKTNKRKGLQKRKLTKDKTYKS